jgi:hypothetical protein
MCGAFFSSAVPIRVSGACKAASSNQLRLAPWAPPGRSLVRGASQSPRKCPHRTHSARKLPTHPPATDPDGPSRPTGRTVAALEGALPTPRRPAGQAVARRAARPRLGACEAGPQQAACSWAAYSRLRMQAPVAKLPGPPYRTGPRRAFGGLR